jgi:hypothetical protein
MPHRASHWKATIHSYSFKKFQKLQQLHALTIAYPKVQKAILVAIVLYGLMKKLLNYTITNYLQI